MINIRKYDIVYVNLNPTIGSEQKGIRPCLVLQNNSANRHSRTTVIAPFTSTLKDYIHHITIEPSPTNGLLKTSCLDILQLKVVDKLRIQNKIGTLEDSYKPLLRRKFQDSFDLNDIMD